MDRNTVLIFGKNSKIKLNKSLTLNANCMKNNKRSTILRIDKKSEFIVNGHASIYYGGDIILFENSKLTIGNSFINSDCKIRCHKEINIGDRCAISHDVTIMDADAHSINGEKESKPVTIKDRVWIGTRATILKGVTVGEGAVIAAGSVVIKDVPNNTVVAGVPAKIVKKDIIWS